MKHIFIFGNSELNIDNAPLELIPILEKRFPLCTFIHADPTEGWHRNEKNLVIIDTVAGIKKVTIFNTLNDFEDVTGKVTVHDYDVYSDLALLLKMKKINSVIIIGIPQKRLTEQTTQDVCSYLAKLLEHTMIN